MNHNKFPMPDGQDAEIIRSLASSTLTPQQAANSLALYISTQVPDLHVVDELESPLFGAWYTVVLMAVQHFPDAHEKLVDMIVCVARLPPLRCCDRGEEEHLAAVRREEEKEVNLNEQMHDYDPVEYEQPVIWPPVKEKLGLIGYDKGVDEEAGAFDEDECYYDSRYEGAKDIKQQSEEVEQVEPGTVEPRQVYCHGAKVWEDLPLFGWVWTEEWESGGPSHLSEERLDLETATLYWYNFNHFAALLFKTGIKVFNYEHLCLWALRGALERSLKNPRNLPNLDQKVPAAAAWILINGRWIYSSTLLFKSSPTEGSPGIGGPIWKGSHGFSKERWSLWRQQLAKIATLDGISEETKIMAAQAEVCMGEIEAEV